MLYIMLGIIIFLLTLCAFGVFTQDNCKHEDFALKAGLALGINILLGLVLWAIYYFFFK